MEFLPWTTFARIVERYGGDRRVRTLSCAKQYRAMAFAQLTYRESLRDIKICLSVHAPNLYHMAFREPVLRSTLADANEGRDWRIHAGIAQRLITQARKLYSDEDLGGVGLDQHCLRSGFDDNLSVSIGLSVGALSHRQGGGEDAHAAGFAGQYSEFHLHLGRQTTRCPCPRHAHAGSRSYLRRGSRLRRLCPPECGAPSRTWMLTRVYSAPTDHTTGILCNQTISLDGNDSRRDCSKHLRRIRFKDPEPG